jgi:glycosyltransferase involved in cell wall biosynthesis
MRWLLISSQHCASHGGIGAYVQRFVSAANESRWHVELVTRPGRSIPPASRVHEIETIDMRPDFQARIEGLRRIERIRPYRYALWSRAVAEKLLGIDATFDAIEFVDCQAEGFAALGCPEVRRKFQGTPMIVHAHTPMFLEEELNGADTSRFGRATYHQWERDALRMADGVMATSRLIADRLHLTNSSLVNPYPIQAGDTANNQQRTHEIVLVGSVQPRKGVVEWARSLNEVFRRSLRAIATLIGPDTPTSPIGGSMAAHLQSLIRPDDRDRFRWCGQLTHQQVIDYVKRAACVIVPSTFESFSFAAAEALCCGTPVIISDQVGIAEHVPGLPMFQRGNISAMARAQLDVLNDPESARRNAMDCRDLLLDRCSPKRHLQRRVEFVNAIRASSRSSWLSFNHEDSLEMTERFIRKVEAEEALEVCDSSPRS